MLFRRLDANARICNGEKGGVRLLTAFDYDVAFFRCKFDGIADQVVKDFFKTQLVRRDRYITVEPLADSDLFIVSKRTETGHGS